MNRIVRTGRINRHERITQTLLSGNMVSIDEIQACFRGTDQEAVLYRLPTNIYNIRLDGGVIRVSKSGRKVTGYQLVNASEFNANGRYVGKSVATVTPEVTPEVEETV